MVGRCTSCVPDTVVISAICSKTYPQITRSNYYGILGAGMGKAKKEVTKNIYSKCASMRKRRTCL